MTGFQIGFDALISLLSAVTGALTVWYSLKGKVEIQQVILNNLMQDMEDRDGRDGVENYSSYSCN